MFYIKFLLGKYTYTHASVHAFSLSRTHIKAKPRLKADSVYLRIDVGSIENDGGFKQDSLLAIRYVSFS
jgi:hypothetical protein